jgi:xanthine dehydrogenase small subunit
VIAFTLNGESVSVPDDMSLLDALREELGCRSVKDGCSPQGQCGCCTVWVDGLPRVSCVTPVRRIAGRSVTTLEGAPEDIRTRWASAFVARGASQCGFCTPGIVLRLAALETEGTANSDVRPRVEAALRAHLCRCTGWQSIVEAASDVLDGRRTPGSTPRGTDPEAVAPSRPEFVRDPVLAAWRAQVEGPDFQSSGLGVVLGEGGFADDTAPRDGLVQLGVDAPPAGGFRRARQGTGRVQQHGAALPPRRVANGGVGPNPADDVGRTCVPRAGRQLVPARSPPDDAIGQRRSLRWQTTQPRTGTGPRPG